MNTTYFLIITFCLGCCAGMIYASVVYRHFERRNENKAMKKFEYYSFTINTIDEADRILDELGKDGWEAYAVADSRIYLKRATP